MLTGWLAVQTPLRMDFPQAWLTSKCQSVAVAILVYFVLFHASIERAA